MIKKDLVQFTKLSGYMDPLVVRILIGNNGIEILI